MYVNRLDCKEYPVIQILDGRTVEGGISGLWQPNGNIRGLGIFFFGVSNLGKKGGYFRGIGVLGGELRIRYTN